LDKWIAENVMKWKLEKRGGTYRTNDLVWKDEAGLCAESERDFHPTIDQRCALDVLAKCLSEKRNQPIISKENNYFWIRTVVGNSHIQGESVSFTETICIFAKELFSAK